jgi:nucleotidyltransferase substrate binding protein (TIGR01987 family)
MPAASEPRLDFSSLRAAIASLASALEIVESEAFSKSDLRWQNTLHAGVVQNFEFTFELSWKMLKRQLEQLVAASEEVDAMGYRDLIRTGHSFGLISDVEVWFEFREWRNITAHTYAKDKALKVVAAAPQLLARARALLAALEARAHG